ncbi:excisionase (plasmid) [Chromobacterium amazonense]|uniref:excisionase n=1 Tax=Chromobacterium amazonense TaxID=1382803 RepID=UPI00237E9FB1|nr:excisionase [Chromobacterium amazonense]MDE1714898.1 excisionase [Chromobacterium amazonense]
MMQSLEEWAASKFGAHGPELGTLRKWARNGCIFPPPQKVGRKWLVESHANYVRPGGLVPVPPSRAQLESNPLIRRIQERQYGKAAQRNKS